MPFKRQLDEFALRHSKLKRIWLFGSRTRGEGTPYSDFDLAFEWEGDSRKEWLQFKNILIDEIRTLHSLDLVYLNEAGAELKETIMKQGKLIYDRDDREKTKIFRKS